MDNAIIAGLSKQIVLARALDVTANNIANQTTAGFKAERVEFREYLAQIDLRGSNAPTRGDSFVSLVIDPDSYTDFSTGGVEATYRDLDFAIDGDGFFALETDEGVRYTRDGRFMMSTLGELVSRNGARVLDTGGAPILFDPAGGALVATPDGDLEQDGRSAARLGIFGFETLAGMRRSADNLFSSDEPARPETGARIRQGFIETSNVAPIASVTEMIEIMRAYEQTARLLETADGLVRDAVARLSRNS